MSRDRPNHWSSSRSSRSTPSRMSPRNRTMSRDRPNHWSSSRSSRSNPPLSSYRRSFRSHPNRSPQHSLNLHVSPRPQAVDRSCFRWTIQPGRRRFLRSNPRDRPGRCDPRRRSPPLGPPRAAVLRLAPPGRLRSSASTSPRSALQRVRSGQVGPTRSPRPHPRWTRRRQWSQASHPEAPRSAWRAARPRRQRSPRSSPRRPRSQGLPSRAPHAEQAERPARCPRRGAADPEDLAAREKEALPLPDARARGPSRPLRSEARRGSEGRRLPAAALGALRAPRETPGPDRGVPARRPSTESQRDPRR